MNLNRLMALYDLVDRAELKYPPFTPEHSGTPEDAATTCSPRCARGDVLLHHPFQGFGPVMDFIKQAAADPQVLAIKQTLYRAGSDSTIVDALADAAQAGKDVTVIIELRARFDEEANIELATKLQEAGAHVMYGVFGFKTHAKLVWSCAARRRACAATATSAPATTTRRPRGCTPTTACSPRTRRSARTSTRSSCSSPG